MSQRTSPRIPIWMRDFVKRYKRHIVIALVFGLIASSFSALLMFTSGYLISATAQTWVTLFTIMIPIACVQVFGLGRPIARYFERLVSHDWVLKITSDLRLDLFSALLAHAGDPAYERPTGEYLGELVDDIAHLQNLYIRVVLPSVIALLLAVGATVLFGAFSFPFACIMVLVFAATVIGIPYASLLTTRALSTRIKSAKDAEFSALTDDVFGAIDWVLARRSFDAIERHAKSSSALFAEEMRVRLLVRLLAFVSTVILGAAVCIVVVWSHSTFDALTDAANWIAAFTLGFFPLIESFALLPEAFAQGNGHLASLGKLNIALNGNKSESAPHAEESPETAPNEPEDASFDIALCNLSYTYPLGSKAALDGINLSVPFGQHVAFLGPSGSGKSTLVGVMRGILPPDSGNVSIGCNDISSLQESMPHIVGYLGQNPYLFNRTIRDNLTMGVVDRDDAALKSIMHMVGLGEKLNALPHALDTVIGETGTGFSGGEAHRLAIARLIAADTPIVVVDEPFASLDPTTESLLADTLIRSCEGKTLIVITHHMTHIERFDRVLLMRDGHIEADGTPRQLMQENERFRSLLDADRS